MEGGVDDEKPLQTESSKATGTADAHAGLAPCRHPPERWILSHQSNRSWRINQNGRRWRRQIRGECRLGNVFWGDNDFFFFFNRFSAVFHLAPPTL